MYSNFEYYAPTKVVFGKGAELEAGRLIREAGARKVLLHYGGKSAKKSGLLDRIIASLDEAGVAHVELGGVVPNPHLGKVYEGIELGRREGVDFILAVGGGSVIDSSKAIAAGLANPEDDVWDYYIHKKTTNKAFPVASVLTIAAAGSEMSNGSVITNETNGLKRDFGGEMFRPVFALMNPELTMTLPPYQTSSGAADIVMHTMERFFNQSDNMEITDRISAAVIKTVMKYTRILVDDPMDYKARAEVMWAGSLSHNDLTGCGADGGDWATHNMEHEMGGMFDVAHGAGLAAIWGSWARYVYQNCLHRFVKFAVDVMQVPEQGSEEDTALAGIEAAEDFFREIGMPTCIRDLGIQLSASGLDDLTRRCVIAVNGRVGSARVLEEPDIRAIYEMAQ